MNLEQPHSRPQPVTPWTGTKYSPKLVGKPSFISSHGLNAHTNLAENVSKCGKQTLKGVRRAA